MGNSLFNGVDIQPIVDTAVGLTKAIKFDGLPLTKVICQNITASVNVALNNYYEIGSKNAYRIMGKPQGSGSVSNILGPTAETVTTLKALCNVCQPKDLIVEFVDTVCKGTKAPTLKFKDCVCNSVQITADAAQDIINGTWQFICTDVQTA